MAAKQPNIVAIMGDDIGIWNIGAYHRGIMAGRTPNLDRLAAEGMLFTDYYAEASCTGRPRGIHHRGNSATDGLDDGRSSGS
jgi:arylsulfatase A-like enzyme